MRPFLPPRIPTHYNAPSHTQKAMSDELSALMLSALEADDTPTQVLIAVSIDEQKQYLERHVDGLTVADRRDLARILINRGRGDSLTACGVGSVINLDLLPHAIISEMYEFAVSQRGKQ